MARTMVIGLTESGANAKVNEDSFSCGDRVYPDMITGSEEQSLGASDYTQVYIVTQGFGGSGAGDLAGRIIQRVTKDFVAQLDNYKLPELDELKEDDDFDTIAGFVLSLLGYIPEKGAQPEAIFKHLKFTVLEMDDRRISRIRLEVLPDKSSGDED
jgi:hypothetical protein